MKARIHRIKARLKTSGEVRWYYYAWRGGPKFWTQDGAPVDYADPPAGFAAALEAARSEGREEAAGRSGERTVDALIDRFTRSGEFTTLAARTRETYRLYLDQVAAEFGADPVALFDDPDSVADILDWRDEKAAAGQLHAADHRVRTLARLLSHGRLLKWITANPAADVPRLYSADRSDMVYSFEERALITEGDGKAIPPAEPHVAAIFTLAFFTGARRKDLCEFSLNADQGDEFAWRTSKSRGRTEALVPILPPLRALLDARRAMKTPAGGPVAATTILVNSRGRPWTPRGLSDAVAKRLAQCRIDKKHLHDARGTFATELMVAGFTDQDVAEFMGWSGQTERVARIRARYVNRKRLIQDRIKMWTKSVQRNTPGSNL